MKIDLLIQLGKKFGVPYDEAHELLTGAKALDMNVIGVSFHVGSGCFDPIAFDEAVQKARGVFDDAARVGYKLSLLDVGGGFPGDEVGPVSFKDICNVLNASLEKYFPAADGVHVIAEPGRYFVGSCGTLVVSVISKRHIKPATAEDQAVST